MLWCSVFDSSIISNEPLRFLLKLNRPFATSLPTAMSHAALTSPLPIRQCEGESGFGELIQVVGTCADESLGFPAHHSALLPLGAWGMGGVMTVAISQSSRHHSGRRCFLCSQCGHMLMQENGASLLQWSMRFCAECASVGDFGVGMMD